MRKLSDIKRERVQDEQDKKDRKLYRDQTGEVPVRLWTAPQMLEYFNEVKKKHGQKIQKVFDKRTIFTQLSGIKRLRIKGDVFVEFVHWAERTNKTFPIDIYHLINQIEKFKKVRKDLFNEVHLSVEEQDQ